MAEKRPGGKREMANRLLNLNPLMKYLEDEECYYLQRPRDGERIVIIGCGMIGMEHIQVTHLAGEAVIYGLCDTDRRSLAVAEKVHEETRQYDREPVVFTSVEEAVFDPEADAFIICTPNFSHREVLEQVIASGKPVLLEKPMATTVEDAAAIMKIAREYESFIQIGLQYRYKSIYSVARRELLENNAIGAVKHISISEHRIPFLDKKRQWNKFSRYSGGTLVEKCCHYFDLFNLFAGVDPMGETNRPVRVFASGNRAVNYEGFEYEGERADIIDNAYSVVEYSDGTRACLDLCMFAPLFSEEMVVCGAGGRLKVSEREDGIEGLTNSLELHRGEEQPSLYGTPRYPQHIEEKGGHHGSKFFEHQSFIRRIRGAANDSASVEEGFWSIVVGAAAEASLRAGTPIRVDELLEQRAGTTDIAKL
jgi:predicted dehydrogenase